MKTNIQDLAQKADEVEDLLNIVYDLGVVIGDCVGYRVDNCEQDFSHTNSLLKILNDKMELLREGFDDLSMCIQQIKLGVCAK